MRLSKITYFTVITANSIYHLFCKVRYHVNIENVSEKRGISEYDIKDVENDSLYDDIDNMYEGSDLQLFSEHEIPLAKDSNDIAQQTE